MILPSPFVYWIQTEKVLSLKIDLKNVVDPDVKILKDKVEFSGDGIGAYGQSHYEFTLDLYSSVKNAVNGEMPKIMHVLDNCVEIVLQKEEPAWWPRLTAQMESPVWLKFNKDLEISKVVPEYKKFVPAEAQNGISVEPKKEIKENKDCDFKKSDYYWKMYICYNLFQFFGYTYVLTVIGTRFAQLGFDSIKDAYSYTHIPLKVVQLVQFLEFILPMLGYTKGSPIVTFSQVGGRVWVLFAYVDAVAHIRPVPTVICLLAWSLVEFVRYTYYLTELCNIHIRIIKWLRYTVWMVLYPVGISSEFILCYESGPYYDKSQKYTPAMPNSWNFTFNMAYIARVYLSVLTIGGLFLISHMYKLRSKKLKNNNDVIKKCK